MSSEAGPGVRTIVIAIDGPAASGKSSTARWVARRLSYRHVDSGALYRAATAAQLRRGTDPERWTEEGVLAETHRIELVPADGTFDPLIDGRRVDGELRGSDVTKHVSHVARMQGVREWVNERVRLAARGHSVVVDGRDIGTAVFPDADIKIFLVADPWERARRRLVQSLGRSPSDDEIAEETDRIAHRDESDAMQSSRAPDSVLIDTTYITQEDQVDRIVALAHAAEKREKTAE
ncbi:MAG: (d)CMP kinase [Gemmatimonadaceae bacterium]